MITFDKTSSQEERLEFLQQLVRAYLEEVGNFIFRIILCIYIYIYMYFLKIRILYYLENQI